VGKDGQLLKLLTLGGIRRSEYSIGQFLLPARGGPASDRFAQSREKVEKIVIPEWSVNAYAHQPVLAAS
jgi:hypothetical protein